MLEESLVCNAEKARDQLATLGKVVSAKLARAMLSLTASMSSSAFSVFSTVSRTISQMILNTRFIKPYAEIDALN